MEKEHAETDKGHEKTDENKVEGKPAKPKSLRGFASMDSTTQRAIARRGGRAAHVKGTAHKFTPEEARRAGRKGGEIVSRDTAHMALIGRKGGEARRGLAARRKAATQKDHEKDSDKSSENYVEKKPDDAKASSAALKGQDSMRRSA